MKICYVISTVNIAGGANRSLLELLPFIIEAGHECTVLANAHGTMEQAVLDLGARYKVLPFATYVRASTTAKRIKRQSANLVGRIAVASWFSSQRFDLVHNNSLPTAVGMDAASRVDIPYICHIRENVWDGLGMEFYCPERVKRIIQGAAKVITISDYIRKSYSDFAPGDNYVTMNDGLRTDDYYTEREILSGEAVRIGIVGIINPQKGQAEAAEAVATLHQRGFSDIELDIIGDEGSWNGSREYAQRLKKKVAENKQDYIHFIPATEDIEELKELRRKCDINLICSKAEGLGRTTIESMLSGSLTIAANAGATPEIMKHMEHGLLYDCGDPEDLADKIEYAVENRPLMKTIAQEGQLYAADRFSIEKYASNILKLYDSVR